MLVSLTLLNKYIFVSRFLFLKYCFSHIFVVLVIGNWIFFNSNYPSLNGSTGLYNPNGNFPAVPEPKRQATPTFGQFSHGSQQQPQQQPGLLYNPAAQIFNDPMANMAVKYGSSLADQGQEYVAQNVILWF